ncbi:mannitol-1-phosphate 5-dehydrogenase [Buchnera aphidicola (Aphis craccivora)]|uniref:Mannitol-1-phosphate 5-dehydrogenase n=2 Tax=cellular organisms TaxID=131567 RepID=A0A6G0VZL1_APHCR|nr:mannitol-1-phosphate 5-dehydrogenase [Buchnera aphidicola]KAF0715599.1 Mannitol-1-phosphate 5-dehydrogenase [Aphis craccivora]QCI16789.1 mannitol-1-phosphate 5-dehydrogenase [Buchnera aphidicola (Aphis craccivora)]QLL40921.1 mannitol-1-phosphate 5-dehydrogenase [Buchnera aphidicola (Aphis craccivore)]WAI17761.1 MAG: mannitol-1-phosphate 5-dehydrogenase [Buchnera aphidicola (Aphis craccivora)]
MKVLHFGAGNIGRGFIGKTMLQSGFDLTFTDINQNLIDALNYYKKYKVKLVGYNYEKIIDINNFQAVNLNNPEILNIISNVSLITTAIGAISLNKIALILAKGIILKIKLKSKTPLNIIACENKIQASSYLRDIIFKIIPIKYHEYLNENIGFVNCSIDTIIPSISSSFEKNTLSLIAENFKEWIVDKKQFKGTIPKIIDMTISNNLKSFIDRKILTLNTGHAITAYLGWIKNYINIYESIKDQDIKNIVKNAMQESGLTLIKKYNFNQQNHFSYIDKILTRFQNPFLLDKIERIARNPLQKLAKNERLIKPLLLAKKYNLSYFNLIKGIAAALYYRNKNDLESMKIDNLIKTLGIKKTLSQISHLQLDSQEINLIISEYTSINEIFSKKLYN